MTEKNKLTMKNDVIFKAFFSKKGNEKYLESFLKEIIGEEVKIKRITHDARLEQLEKEQKYGILDLDVELEDGKLINIEMQIRNNKNIEKRTTYYGSKKLISQMRIGTEYKENKEIKEAVEEYETLTGDALVKRLAEVRMLGEMEEQAALSAAKEEEKISIAKKLLKLKMPIEQIIEITELTKEEIENIRNKN